MAEMNFGALKLVPFWPDDPFLWFVQIDAQFYYYNVKDDFTKYNYIIAHLDKHCLTMVKDIVLSPPVSNKYETLKKELLKRLRESSIKNVKKILEAEDIGEKKPSQFLKHLKGLAGPDVDEDYIKSVWSSRLPSKVQWVASFLTSSSLEKIAQLADLAVNSPSVVAPDNNKPEETKPMKQQSDDSSDKLTKRVDDLTKRVEELTLKVDTDMRPASAKTATVRARHKK